MSDVSRLYRSRWRRIGDDSRTEEQLVASSRRISSYSSSSSPLLELFHPRGLLIVPLSCRRQSAPVASVAIVDADVTS